MAAQIIYLVLITISLVGMGLRHGTYRKEPYNVGVDLLSLSATLILLYWGGFFDVLFR